MTGKLDRYVSKTVFGAYSAGLLFLMLMVIVFDVLFELQYYLRHAEESGAGILEMTGRMLLFYVVSVPFFFVLIGPFVTVIAGMFAVARLMGANEVVPMLFAGRSMLRVLRPLLTIGLLSAAAMVLCWQFVLPNLIETRDQMKASLKGTDAQLENLVVQLRDGERQTLFVDAYDHASRRMTGVSLLDEGSGAADIVVISAIAADWNPEQACWELTDGQRRTPDGIQRVATLGLSTVTPELLWRTSKEKRELFALSYDELRDLQLLNPGRTDYELAFHAHLTFPLANLILLMLALPFAVHFERGRRIERVLYAVLICAIYLAADLTCQNLSRTDYLHPIFAAWLPPIFFGSLGAVLFGSIRT